ncbi:MAG: acetyl-CoA carboxylase biotin carboxyl carrier protein [Acidobacteriota bacterium]
MNFKEILELIDKVADKGIAGLEIEQAGLKLRIDGKSAGPQVVHAYGDHKAAGPAAAPVASTVPLAEAPSLPKPPAEPEAEAGVHIITSPIVGTFYRSPNPEAQAFVNVGDRIAKGQVICIIEAMKLMNEIESDVDGVIAQMFPSNGQPIEYGERLFAVKI